jgi:DNA-binding MarR family transcriptional regulator
MDRADERQQLFELFNEIAIIDQLMNNVFHRRMPLSLSVAHFGVINHLVRLGDGRTPVSIASAFQVTKPTMTNTLAKLEGLGLIEIRPNPDDGRSKLVFLTEAGREFRASAIAAISPDLAELTTHIPIDALTSILPQLRTLRSYLDHNRPA